MPECELVSERGRCAAPDRSMEVALQHGTPTQLARLPNAERVRGIAGGASVNGFLRPLNLEYANGRNLSRVRDATPSRRALDRTRPSAETLPNTRAKAANRSQLQPRNSHRFWIIPRGQATRVSCRPMRPG